MLEKQGSLVREVAAILRDYQDRIDRLGPETLRLRGEDHREWERKRRRIRLCLGLIEAAAAEGRPTSGMLAEVAAANVAALREHLARLHRENPVACQGQHCPCRPEARP